MLELTGKNFDTEVLQSSMPVIVLWGSAMDVNSNECALKMEGLEFVGQGRLKLGRVDIDQSPDLVMRFSVRDVPLMVFMMKGMALAQDTSFTDKFVTAVYSHLK